MNYYCKKCNCIIDEDSVLKNFFGYGECSYHCPICKQYLEEMQSFILDEEDCIDYEWGEE